MATYTSDTLAKAIKKAATSPAPVYLIVGERFLCRQAAADLTRALLPDEQTRAANLTAIDGDQEDPAATLAALRSYGLFPGRKVFLVKDSRLPAPKVSAREIYTKAEAAWREGKATRAGRLVLRLAALAKMEPAELAALSPEAWDDRLDFTPGADTAWIAAAGAAVEGARTATATDITDAYIEAWKTETVPADNILVLLTEAADKRKKLYQFIKKHGVVIDLSVAAGSGRAAREGREKVLRGLVGKVLKEWNKTMEPAAVSALLDRVGFHPVAVVRETEKLVLYADNRPRVTQDDVNTLIGRTREDALYELTEAVTRRQVEPALRLAARMHAAGTHPLVMVAGTRNQFRRLLAVKALMAASDPPFIAGMSFPAFQKGYLPQAKDSHPHLLALLPNHPYALHMLMGRGNAYTTAEITTALGDLLAMEMRMKSGGLPPRDLFENFLLRTVPQKNTAGRTHLRK